MNARDRLRIMIRSDRGSMTVWSQPEIDAAFARYDEEHRAEVLAEDHSTPLVVSRFDTATEPAIEEKPILTVGCIAEDGRPVALLLDVEDRRKVARWLAPELEEATAAAATATPTEAGDGS